VSRGAPIVALVGRPNVGKSTLFNRIVGQRLAVVHDRPGTTRDRIQSEATWGGVTFTLVDTGGLETLGGVPLAEDSAQFIPQMRVQAEMAIADADVLIFVVDAMAGITAADQEVTNILRRADKPVIVAVSKADNAQRRADALEFHTLGMGEVYPVSGLHGTSVGDLLDALVVRLPHWPEEDEADKSVKIAIVGRPNVGKSSLLNHLLGEERAIVSEVAGTTRDAIDTRLVYHGVPITLIDTAGIRRRGKIVPGVERYSVLRALRAIQRSDVVLLLLDAQEVMTAQDAHVAGFILDEMKSVVVLVNKWDLIAKDTHTMQAYTQQIRRDLRFMDYVPLLFISALTGQRVGQVIPTALRVQEERLVRIPTAQVNRIVREAVSRQAPPSKGGKRLKIRYASQVAVDPPTFLFHVNDVDLVHFSYERYLENQIRRAYPFTGTPVRLSFRRSTSDDKNRR
jgi:GTP-binding protein